MEQQGKAGLIGEVVRIKTTGELALIIAEDTPSGGSYADIIVMVRQKDGSEKKQSLVDLDRFLSLEETASFRILMRQKYPSVMIQ